MDADICVSGLIINEKAQGRGKSPRSPSSVRVTSKLSIGKGEKINPDQWKEELEAQREHVKGQEGNFKCYTSTRRTADRQRNLPCLKLYDH